MTHLIHYTLPESDVVVTAEYTWKQTSTTDGYYERIECSVHGVMLEPNWVFVHSDGVGTPMITISGVLDAIAGANHADWYAEDDAAMRADVAERRE